MSNEIYSSIYKEIIEDPKVQAVSKLGNCRNWTRETILALRRISTINNLNLSVEARETDIEPSLSHTFVRFFIDEEPVYIFDGTGVGFFDPYFGPENEAPEHLRNSRYDMINYYLRNNANSSTRCIE